VPGSRLFPSPRLAGSAVALALAGFLIGCARHPQLPSSPPILLLTVDTLRADHLSTYGYPRETSPAIDRIAREGTRFDFAITQWPKTGPSFASIMTSTYPKDNNIVRRVGIKLSCSFRLLAEKLHRLGYDTRGVVSNGALGREFAFDQGFDDYVETWKDARGAAAINVATRAERVTDLALASADARDRSKPLFLWVHYLDPHFPYDPPQEYRDRFQGDGLVATGATVPIDRTSSRRFDDAIGNSQVLDGRSDLDFYVARYDAEIAYTDHEIGRLIEGLQQRGLYQRMLVVFTSDHGEALGEHGYYFGHGMYPFQDGLHVPLIVRLPHVVPRGVDKAPVPLLDVSPTILQAAGESLPNGRWQQGRSLLHRLWSRSPEKGRLVYSESGVAIRRHWMKSVTDGRYKLVWVPSVQAQRRVLKKLSDFALFDLNADPGEVRDIATDHQRIVYEFQSRLRTWFLAPKFLVDLDPADCSPGSQTAPATLEQLKALGYL